MKVKAEVFDLDADARASQAKRRWTWPRTAWRARSSIPEIAGPQPRRTSCACGSPTTKGALLSRNFYWLSTKKDELDWKNTKWYYTPTTRHADLTALAALPPTTLAVSARPRARRPRRVGGHGPEHRPRARLPGAPEDGGRGDGRGAAARLLGGQLLRAVPRGDPRAAGGPHHAAGPAPLQVQASAWNAPVVVRMKTRTTT